MAAQEEGACCAPLPAGGYDYEFVDSPSEAWECPVCLSTLRDPHLLSCCGVKICQSCIKGIQNANRPCPKCRREHFTTLLEKELQRSILGLRVKCSVGCSWIGELRHLERHISPSDEGDCPLVEVRCQHGCGQVMKRSDEREHVEETCSKRPIEFQLARLQSRLEGMCCEITKAHQIEIQELRTKLEKQEELIQKMKAELEELKEDRVQLCTTTIPVFSPSVLCIMPKLPSGNIPGVSYFPKDKFVKITGSCEQELEARTHLFLSEYEKILPRLSKEEFKVNEHFPLESLKQFVNSCNKKFSACYVSFDSEAIELVSTNASQFEMAKKLIIEKTKHKIFKMRFPDSMHQMLTLKRGNIKEEVADVIILFIGNEPISPSHPFTTSLFRLLSSEASSTNVTTTSVPPGKAILVKEPKYCAKNIVYISSLALYTTHGYFGKEAYTLLSDSLKEALKSAVSVEAKSIAFPCEVSSGGMQSNYVIPAVINMVSELYKDDKDCCLTDVCILFQDDKIDDDQLSSYFKYLALKYHLQ